MKSPEEIFIELNLDLPNPPAPIGVYKPYIIEGNILYLSGHGTIKKDGTFILGKVGRDMDKDSGKAAARQVGLAEHGVGVRSAVGMGSLPDGIPVEIEAQFLLHE